MAYEIRSEKGLPIKKQGDSVLAMDNLEIKIEQLSEKDMSFIAVASTEHEDRDKDIVRQEGWKLANYRKNPIIPWSHNYYGIPLAKSMKTWIDKDHAKGPRLLFNPKFDQEDAESVKVFNKYKNGFLTSFSVGFRGIKFNFRDEEDRWWGGREFLEQELLEISAVSVPANPHANTRMGYTGEVSPENLIQMGYPEVFAKTEGGLFYPVMDIAIFTQPKEFEVDKGVIGINAVALDEEIKVSNPVAYIFDPNMFDDKSANEWIESNVDKKWEIKYFDLRHNQKGDFTLECITEPNDIKVFESSIDLADTKESDDVSENKDEDIESSEKSGEEDLDTNKAEEDVSEDSKSNSNEESTEDKSNTDDNEIDDTKTDTSDVDNKDKDVLIPVKCSIIKTITLKDEKGEVIDEFTQTIASSKEFKTVDEYMEWDDNKVISLLKSEISKLNKDILELANKKTVANASEIIDNKESDNEDELENKSSTNDDMIELDASLLKSPDNEDKTDSSEFIELDESMFDNSQSKVVKTAIKESLTDKLRKTLNEALGNLSGKID